MDKFIVNGVTFTDFGTNNYSNGMHLITAASFPATMVQDVLAGKYPGIHLNPSAPCGEEFFGVFGTPEQYSEFYNRQKNARLSSQILNKMGYNWDDSRYQEIKAEVEANYKDWWE